MIKRFRKILCVVSIIALVLSLAGMGLAAPKDKEFKFRKEFRVRNAAMYELKLLKRHHSKQHKPARQLLNSFLRIRGGFPGLAPLFFLFKISKSYMNFVDSVDNSVEKCHTGRIFGLYVKYIYFSILYLCPGFNW